MLETLFDHARLELLHSTETRSRLLIMRNRWLVPDSMHPRCCMARSWRCVTPGCAIIPCIRCRCAPWRAKWNARRAPHSSSTAASATCCNTSTSRRWDGCGRPWKGSRAPTPSRVSRRWPPRTGCTRSTTLPLAMLFDYPLAQEGELDQRQNDMIEGCSCVSRRP